MKSTKMTDRIKNLFGESQPDARQSMDPSTKPTRFRPVYRPLTLQELALHNEIKEAAERLESLIDRIPGGRYQSLAYTALEESVVWAIKGLTA